MYSDDFLVEIVGLLHRSRRCKLYGIGRVLSKDTLSDWINLNCMSYTEDVDIYLAKFSIFLLNGKHVYNTSAKVLKKLLFEYQYHNFRIGRLISPSSHSLLFSQWGTRWWQCYRQLQSRWHTTGLPAWLLAVVLRETCLVVGPHPGWILSPAVRKQRLWTSSLGTLAPLQS